MNELTEFLLARIAEDEKQAGVCRELGWFPAEKYGVPAVSHARVLAECAAKRAIVDARPITNDVIEVSTRIKWGYALRALAAIYKDHPEYPAALKGAGMSGPRRCTFAAKPPRNSSDPS